MGQSFGSNVRWTTDDIPKLDFYSHKSAGGNSSHSMIFRGSRSGLSESRHPSPSLAYDYAHEGLWDQLVARCQEYPSDCMYIDRFYNTPLHLACRRKPPLSVLQALIQANSGALRIRTVDGLTPLHFACYCGAEYSIIYALTHAYPEAAGLCDQRGRTPLHFTTAGLRTADRAKVIQCLLDVKSDVVNWEDDRGRTPLTLLFEDYAEEIEGDELQEVLSRMITLRRQATPQDLGNHQTRVTFEHSDSFELGSIGSHSGIDWDEVSECWESIMFLIKASYFHLHRDSMLLSTLLESESDNETFNSAKSFSSGTLPDLLGRSNVGGAKGADEDFASELKWNMLHATVGVPHCPAKFVQIVIHLYPELVSQKDVNGNLPLHIAARRTEFRAGEAEGSFPAPLVPIHQSRESVQKSALHKISTMNGSGDKHGSLGLYKTHSHGSIAFCVDLRDVMEEKRYKESASIIIQDLVRIYPAAVKAEDADGKTPLLLAIEHGKPWESGVHEILKSYKEGLDEEKIQESLLVGLTAELSSLSKRDTALGYLQGTNIQEDYQNKESNYIFKQITCNTVQLETVKTLQKLLPLFTKVSSLAELFLSQCQLSTYSETINPIHDVATKFAMLEALASVLRFMKSSSGNSSSLVTNTDASDIDIMKRGLLISEPLLYGTQKCIREGAAQILGAACNGLGPDATTEVLRDVILLSSGPANKKKNGGNASEVDRLSSPTMANNTDIDEILGHGKAWGIYNIFCLPVGKLVDPKIKYFVDDKHDEAISVLGLVKDLVQHNSIMVREAACRAIGVIIGSSVEPKSCLKEVKGALLKVMRLAESTEVLTNLAKGLTVAARECKGLFRGKPFNPILDGALMLALSGPSTVKVAYNDFLWLALDVGEGNEGLHEYMKLSQGDNGKIMMTLVTKVLGQMDGVSDLAS
mmetsp:Transcript_28586/g.40931  ORF Transcript_28586/g.40931 Transcript_28586/m.40931 type:complete len:924 (+) Transcript_28586:46-2817(+)|eukprot:CAMPEP_0172431544 /NCGR_PEP_ID=MMETSP1064-20121228/58864_1 /TAXON_ID=202472 /ORGANISM="Aulacoseira subarctica , Strain CCAP 1002/5" /LENGTH=923 /DNA_ID=CAMNT_0013178293 /DNA_START=6 /DNA_END=2777 /DNA_ORIENTATION=+